MHGRPVSLLLLSLVVAGCSQPGFRPAARSGGEVAAHEEARGATGGDGRAAPEAEGATRPGEAKGEEARRQPGDFVAYRFAGSFRKRPLLLTQRVVAREGELLVVDLTLEGAGAPEMLRVRMSDAPASRGEVASAAWIDGDAERPAPLGAYEAMMAKTTLAADANEAVLADEAVVVQVGGAPLACRSTRYRVRIGKTTATLRTLQSDGFAWGDVGGEITAEDGRVLYRAELVEAGHADPAQAKRAATVAQSDD